MLSCFKKNKPSQEKYREIAQKKNQLMLDKFASTSYSERIILVPQCLRNVEKCKAKELGSYYICAECNACKIGPVNRKAKSLGYKALYILKGGRTIEKLIKETNPKAVLGVACFFEGVQGMNQCEEFNIIAQFVPLTKDGCVNTDIDLDEVLKILDLSTTGG